MTVRSEQPFPADVLDMARGMLQSTLRPGESLDDVLSGSVHLAVRRATLQGRDPPFSTDLLLMFSLFLRCAYDPRFAPDYMEQVARVRQNLFTGAAGGNFERLDKAVPAATLSLTFDEIYLLHARGDLEGFLRLPPEG
jgi:hypothetical protein